MSKKNNNYENYSISEIIKKYSKIIGEKNIKQVVYSVLKDNVSQELEREINDQATKIYEIKGYNTDEEYISLKKDIMYKKTIESLEENDDVNFNERLKMKILINIYKNYSNILNKKGQRDNIMNLLMGNSNTLIFEFFNEEYDGIKDCEIINRFTEKIDSVYPKNLRNIMNNYFDNILRLDVIKSIISSGVDEVSYDRIMKKLKNQFFLYQGRVSTEKYKNYLENNSVDELFEENLKEIEEAKQTGEIIENYNDSFNELAIDYFKNNLQFIDKEALLLDYACKLIMNIKVIKSVNNVREDEKKLNNKLTILDSISVLKDILYELNNNKKISKHSRYMLVDENQNEIISADMNYIDEFLKRCTTDDYITDEEINEIHEKIKKGNVDDDYKKNKIANVNLQDLHNINEFYESLDIEDEVERHKVLSGSNKLIEYLKSAEDLHEEQILNLFLEGKLNTEVVTNAKLDIFNSKYIKEKFNNLYLEMTFANDKNEQQLKMDMLYKFSNLINVLEEKGKLSLDRNEIEEYFINLFGTDVAPEIFYDLERIGFSDLNTAIEWTDLDIFKEKYLKGDFRPEELRSYYNSKSKKEQEVLIVKIASMINGIQGLDNTQKFGLIGNIFPGTDKDEASLRNYLVRYCLQLNQNNIADNFEGLEDDDKTILENNHTKSINSKEYNKRILDPFARTRFFKSLDKDLICMVKKDGHAIYVARNSNKVIIEKYFNKKGQIYYGAASYILDLNYFNSHKSEIIDGDFVIRKELIDNIKRPEIEKVSHHGKKWIEDITEIFGVGKDKYTEDELQEIKEAGKDVLESMLLLTEKNNIK